MKVINTDLKQIWDSLAASLCFNSVTAEIEWKKLSGLYQGQDRYYHNLAHLEHMLTELHRVKEKLKDLTAITYAVFYHDAVYDVHEHDNEERSTLLAGQFLQSVNRPLASKVSALILSTKKHSPLLNDPDNRYFIDADLAIFGTPAAVYTNYSQNIRNEYFWLSDEAFNTGRSQVLKKFLLKNRLYYTDEFYTAYEQQARANISHEIEMLQMHS